MNQDALGEDVISIVEGENDLLSIVGKAKQPDVLATIGNHNTPNILKHLTQNSAGKTFRLVFDRDEAGEKYTSKYADAIKKGGGKVYKINIPPPHNDIDEFLRKADNLVEAFNRLIENATLLNPVEITDERPILERFNSFQVLGELADERIAFWSRVSKKLYRVSIRDLNLDKLDQIGGEEVIAHVSRKPQDGKITFRTLKRAIIVAASQKQLGNPEYVGQGIHLVGPDKLLIINGADAWIWDGKKGARHESPVV